MNVGATHIQVHFGLCQVVSVTQDHRGYEEEEEEEEERGEVARKKSFQRPPWYCAHNPIQLSMASEITKSASGSGQHHQVEGRKRHMVARGMI